MYKHDCLFKKQSSFYIFSVSLWMFFFAVHYFCCYLFVIRVYATIWPIRANIKSQFDHSKLCYVAGDITWEGEKVLSKYLMTYSKTYGLKLFDTWKFKFVYIQIQIFPHEKINVHIKILLST